MKFSLREGPIGFRFTKRDPYQTIESGDCDCFIFFGMKWREDKGEGPPFNRLIAVDGDGEALRDFELSTAWVYLTQTLLQRVGPTAIAAKELDAAMRRVVDKLYNYDRNWGTRGKKK